MADLKLVTISPPYNGMNTVAAPGKCPEGMGPLVRNFLVHVPGKLPMRGPMTPSPYTYVDTNSISTAPNIITGAWSFNSKILVGFTNKTTGIAPWVAPYYRATLESQLSKPSTTGALVDIVAGTASKVTFAGTNQVPLNSGARIEGNVYGIAYGWSTIFTDKNGGIQGMRPFLKWDGTTTPPIVYANAPFSSQDIKSYLNRIFLLGGALAETWTTSAAATYTSGKNKLSKLTKDEYDRIQFFDEVKGPGIQANTTVSGKFIDTPTGTPVYGIYLSKNPTETKTNAVEVIHGKHEPNTLFWSAQGGPITDELSVWKDEVSGLTNRIIVGDDDQNDYGVGMAIVNQSMVIFKRHSIWALYGYSPSTFQIRNLTTERGCIDPNSIYEDDGGVYFASQHGLEYFNGEQFVLVDAPIANKIRPLMQEIAGEKKVITGTTVLGRVSITYAGNDYIFVTVCSQATSSGSASFPNWAGYMHTTTGNWSEFTTSAWSSTGQPMYVDSTESVPWAWDGRQVNPMPWLTDPWSADVNSQTQVDKTLAGAKKAIPAKYQTDRIQLASPGYTSQYHRFLFDYRWPNGGSDSSASPGWYVTLFGDQSTETPINEAQVPGQADLESTAYLNGRRWEKDVHDEAVSATLQVEWKNSELEVALPEIYDTTIELQVARQRRSV